MTCKDCLHGDVCVGYTPTDLDRDVWHYCTEGKADQIPDIEERCCDFKDRTKYVEKDDMRAFAEDVVYQFGYYGQHNGRLHIIHAGLSALESAFDILGWENPHPAPEYECEIDGCHERATCGTPTKDGYKRVCVKHWKELQEEADDGS